MNLNKTDKLVYKPIDAALFLHTAAFGASGSGKTRSVISPKTEEILTSRTLNGEEVSALIIDAKNEYQQIVQNILGDTERVIVLDGSEPRFNPFEINMGLSMVEKIMPIYDSCAGTSVISAGDNSIFAAKGRAVFRSFLLLEQAYYDKTGRSLFSDVNQFKDKADIFGLSATAIKAVFEEKDEKDSSFFSKKDSATEFNLNDAIATLSFEADYFAAFNQFIDSTTDSSEIRFKGWNLALNSAIFLAEKANVPTSLYSFIYPYRNQDRSMANQWYYNISYFQSMFSLLLNESVRKYCELNPFATINPYNLECQTKALLPHWNKGGGCVVKNESFNQ